MADLIEQSTAQGQELSRAHRVFLCTSITWTAHETVNARYGTDIGHIRVHTLLQAEVVQQEHGIGCEVIDLRTLLPWDREAVGALLPLLAYMRAHGHTAPLAGTVATL